MRQNNDQDAQSRVVSFVLLSSPEALVLPVWMTILDQLTKLGMLNLTFIDEVSFCAEFALSFRKYFLLLRDEILNKIIVQNTSPNDMSINNTTLLKNPFLCMTDT